MFEENQQIIFDQKQVDMMSYQIQNCIEKQANAKMNIQKGSFEAVSQNNSHEKQNQPLVLEAQQKLTNKLIWSNEELKDFKNLYLLFGPNWVQISKELRTRSVSNLKNYFTNSLRKISNKIDDYNEFLGLKGHKNCKNHLLTLLEVINQAQKYIQNLKLTFNPQSGLLRLKFLVVELCFQQEHNEHYIRDIVKLSKFFGSKLKCLGVFKTRCRKSWRLTFSSFSKILLFDPIVRETMEQILDPVNNSQQFPSLPALEEQIEVPFSNKQIYGLIEINDDHIIEKQYGDLNLIVQLEANSFL